jgi:hypothetical protein
MDSLAIFIYNPAKISHERNHLGERGGIMRVGRLSALVVIVCLATAASISAQMGMRSVHLPPGFFNPVMGGGASYQTTDSDGRTSGMELALIGKESVNGKDGYWIEWTMPDRSIGTILAKELVVVGDKITISRVVFQMAGRPPMVMPEEMTSNMEIKPSDIRTKADDLGSESITVPAGTFSCEHYRAKDSGDDTWISSKVSPIGLVKDQSKDQTRTTVLVKTYTDAKDKITGTPQPFNPMMMMPPRQ